MKYLLISLCLLSLLIAPQGVKAEPRVFEIELNGVVNPIIAEHIEDKFDEINQGPNSGVILLTVDTPGGHSTAMRTIIKKILASRLPVVVFVTPSGARAASAGFFLLMAADIAAMSPGTNTGAAHPVMSIGGIVPVKTEDIDKTMMEKVMARGMKYMN